MGVQVYNLLFKHFDFPLSVTLDSTNSFFGGEKIFLTARFLAWLSSERPSAFHVLSSITFSQTFLLSLWDLNPGRKEFRSQ